jgi:DNA adenine methylase
MRALTRPALRWHGGKWRLAPWILSHFPAHRCYVEPYGGGASVLLRKAPSDAEVYNDLDGDVVTLFRVLRDAAQSDRLVRLLRLTPFARAEFEGAYEPTEDPVERARRLVVRSYMGFGSSALATHATGFRDYSKSHQRRRYPAGDWANYPACLTAVVERFRAVIVDDRDALEVIARHDSPDTLFYVDPPYVLSTRGSARGVRQKYSHEMTDDDHRQLAGVLHGLRGPVVLSAHPSPLYTDLYAGWSSVSRGHMADGAKPRVEVLWLNPACSRALGWLADVGGAA